jgi:hypothetical protein
MGSTLIFGVALSVTLEGEVIDLLPILVAIIVGFFLVIPSALFRKWYFIRRRLKKNVITAEYEPPLELNPAEVGYLFDGKLREQEVGAVIISLVQRGLLHVRKIEGQKRIFAGPRVDEHVRTYEKKLLDEADKEEGVTAEQLLGRFTTRSHMGKKTVTFGSKEFLFSQLVHNDLRHRGYIKEKFTSSFLYASFKIALLLEILLVFVPVIVLYIRASLQMGTFNLATFLATSLIALLLLLFTFVPLFISAMILVLIRSKIVGREWIITEKLRRLWPQIVSYRQYIQLVEADKLEFQSKQLETASKNDILAYAVALGYVKNWRDIIG